MTAKSLSIVAILPLRLSVCQHFGGNVLFLKTCSITLFVCLSIEARAEAASCYTPHIHQSLCCATNKHNCLCVDNGYRMYVDIMTW